MQKGHKRLFMLLLILTALFICSFSATTAHAAGFKKMNGKTYYIKSDGSKAKGWLKLGKKRYYFNKITGAQIKGWVKLSNGKKRYFTKGAGYMVTGWLKDSKGNKRYFLSSNGFMKTGWSTYSNGKKRYFSAKNGIMLTGWVKNSSGNLRYFNKSNGYMFTGLHKIDGKTYYFYSKSGVMANGWLTSSSGNKRYFDKTGVMAIGQQNISGTKYIFSNSGILIGTPTPIPTSTPIPQQNTATSKTIKNYLKGALQPVGKALYVWGGGWNDSTRKGLSQTMTDFYNNQTGDYNYKDYKDLSTSTRAKGFDCSGFVGWSAYQVMKTKSNMGYGYTVVAEEVGSYYESLGWGTVLNQAYLSKNGWTLKPGDVGFNSGHTWIVIGQCSDKSVVIVHSTPNAGVQISGTSTPGGNYNSEAIYLAERYMSRYSGFSKYNYHTSCGNYIRNGNYLRWNRSTLSDPDGYMNMTADKILVDLFR